MKEIALRKPPYGSFFFLVCCFDRGTEGVEGAEGVLGVLGEGDEVCIPCGLIVCLPSICGHRLVLGTGDG
jgi:hypothetical protein